MSLLKNFKIWFDDLCYALDFFKIPFTFHFSRKRRLISNKIGTFFSLLIIFYLLYELTTSDMLQKTNPSVLTQKVFGPIRPKIALNDSNFELAIGIFDDKIVNYEIDSSELEIFTRQLKVKYIEKNNTIIRNETITNLEIRNCTQSDLHLSEVSNMFQGMKCLHNFELETYGYVNEYEYSAFKIKLAICDNATSKTVCKPKEEIYKKMQNKFLGLHYIDNNINYNNFRKPIVQTPQADYIALDPNYNKMRNIFLTKFEFLDDYDLFGSNPHISHGFFRSMIVNDFVLIDQQNSSNFETGFLFLSSPETQQNIRTYQKINQLFSNIGGSASLFISIGFFFASFFNDWALRASLFKNMYDLEEEDLKNQEDKKNINNNNNENLSKNNKDHNNNDLKNQKVEEEKQKFNEDLKVCKVEMKKLKPDSFPLERNSVENENKLANAESFSKKKKRKKLSLWKHIIFKIKAFLGLKLNETNEIYQILDRGFSNIINGNFIFEKFQELECAKKIIFSEKEIILMNSLKRPQLILKLNNIYNNVLKNNHFGLYPIKNIDDKLKEYDEYHLEKLFQEWKFEKKNMQTQQGINEGFKQKLMLIMSTYKNY